jgi:hypothetical protein
LVAAAWRIALGHPLVAPGWRIALGHPLVAPGWRIALRASALQPLHYGGDEPGLEGIGEGDQEDLVVGDGGGGDGDLASTPSSVRFRCRNQIRQRS